MDGWVVVAIAVVTGYVGYFVGVIASGRWIGRGGGGEGVLDPGSPPGSDFALWELEVTEVPTRRG